LCNEVHALRHTRGKQKPFFFCDKACTNVFLRTEWSLERLEEWIVQAKGIRPSSDDECARANPSCTEYEDDFPDDEALESTKYANIRQIISEIADELQKATEERRSLETGLRELKTNAMKR